MEIEQSKLNRLRALHAEIIGGMRKTIAQAIEAGGILSEVKAALPHGAFTKWVEENTGFDIRTAQNYMRTHANRERIESENVSRLTEAYRLLEDRRAEVENTLSTLEAKKQAANKRAQEAAIESLKIEAEIGAYRQALARKEELLAEIDPLLADKDSTDPREWMGRVSSLSLDLEKVWAVLIPEYDSMKGEDR